MLSIILFCREGASIDINLMASSKQSGKVYEYTIFERPKYGTLLTENNKIVRKDPFGVSKIIRIKYIADFKNDIRKMSSPSGQDCEEEIFFYFIHKRFYNQRANKFFSY